MKKFKFCAAALLMILILSGCRPKDVPNASLRLVTEINVICYYGDSQLERHYTAPDKMEQVLLYLRLLDRGLEATMDPEKLDGIHYKIVLHYSNGQQRIYHQRTDGYISEDFKPWLKIDPEQGKLLLHLLLEVPSDTI